MFTMQVHRCETKILRLNFRPKMQLGEEWVAYKARTARIAANQVEEIGSAVFGRIVC